MKCTKIVLSGLVAFTATANAMPTQEETKKVAASTKKAADKAEDAAEEKGEE